MRNQLNKRDMQKLRQVAVHMDRFIAVSEDACDLTPPKRLEAVWDELAQMQLAVANLLDMLEVERQ